MFVSTKEQFRKESVFYADKYGITDLWERDAFRHTYSGARMSSLNGDFNSWLFGQANEWWYGKSLFSDDGSENTMDRYNNRVGRQIAGLSSDPDVIALMTFRALKSGMLINGPDEVGDEDDYIEVRSGYQAATDSIADVIADFADGIDEIENAVDSKLKIFGIK